MTQPLSNQQVIYNFWISKGYSAADAFGFVGNAKEEANFSPTAYNPNEGALGIVQWEGGRLSALKAYAASVGQAPTDLMTQLNYQYQELTTRYGKANADIKAATTPGAAAIAIASEYEVSASSNWQARADYANKAAAGQSLAGPTYTGSTGSGGVNSAVFTGVSTDILPGGSWDPANWPGELLGGAASSASGAVANSVEKFVLALVKPFESWIEDAALIILGAALLLVAAILAAHAAESSGENAGTNEIVKVVSGGGSSKSSGKSEGAGAGAASGVVDDAAVLA